MARSLQTLQPTNLLQRRTPCDECDDLSVLEPGDPPMLPESIWSEFTEWFDGWGRAADLTKAKIALPGPVLLHGPTGTGKTMLAKSIANQMPGRPAVVLEVSRAIESLLGGTGLKLDKVFRVCNAHSALLVLEEIDGISSARSNLGSCAVENNRITIALMRLFEQAKFPIVATTNRADSLDPALLRRFEFKIEIQPLSDEGRKQLLTEILGKVPPVELLAMPLHEAMPMIHRLKRREFLKGGKK